MTTENPIHAPYGFTVALFPPAKEGGRIAPPRCTFAAQLASGAHRAACYAVKGAAGPGRIDPSPLGPIHGPYSRSA